MKHGADANGREPAAAGSAHLLTPLHAAILQHEEVRGWCYDDSRPSVKIIKCLLDAGADPQLKYWGETALQLAMQHALNKAQHDEFFDSTDPFECLLAHSSQRLSAAELVSTAWSLAGAEQLQQPAAATGPQHAAVGRGQGLVRLRRGLPRMEPVSRHGG